MLFRRGSANCCRLNFLRSSACDRSACRTEDTRNASSWCAFPLPACHLPWRPAPEAPVTVRATSRQERCKRRVPSPFSLSSRQGRRVRAGRRHPGIEWRPSRFTPAPVCTRNSKPRSHDLTLSDFEAPEIHQRELNLARLSWEELTFGCQAQHIPRDLLNA